MTILLSVLDIGGKTLGLSANSVQHVCCHNVWEFTPKFKCSYHSQNLALWAQTLTQMLRDRKQKLREKQKMPTTETRAWMKNDLVQVLQQSVHLMNHKKRKASLISLSHTHTIRSFFLIFSERGIDKEPAGCRFCESYSRRLSRGTGSEGGFEKQPPP